MYISEENWPRYKGPDKRRHWIILKVQRKSRANNKALKNFQKLKKETNNGQDYHDSV